MEMFECPHCKAEITLLEQKDLKTRYRFSPNSSLRNSDQFPEPLFGGPKPQKYWWLKEQIEEFAAGDYVQSFDGMSKEGLQQVIKALEAKLEQV